MSRRPETQHARQAVDVPGGIAAVPGFRASAVHCGIKRKHPDLALLAAPTRCTAAATYTRNAVQAAPLRVCRRHLADGGAQAVVVASGVANTCTGERGERDAEAMAMRTAEALGVSPADVVVASTGVIGPWLPMDRVHAGIREAAAALDADGGEAAAAAIMTTDTRPKLAAERVPLPGLGAEVTVGGIAKGSGMIHPDMATMLAFLATDAPLPVAALNEALREAVDASFNVVTVDGDTSPNDMVAMLAAGTAATKPLKPGAPDWARFCDGLTRVCAALARQIVADGEGARRVFAVEVRGAADRAQARLAARRVASSSLVKAAVHGRDANWGRVLVAAGASGARMEPDRASLTLVARGRELSLFHRGAPRDIDDALAAQLLGEDGVTFRLDLGLEGAGTAVARGCDLSEEYVHINAAYRT